LTLFLTLDEKVSRTLTSKSDHIVVALKESKNIDEMKVGEPRSSRVEVKKDK